jgi:hypothetical protein
MSLDRIRLARVLEMIGSSFDGEALVAARRAHALVKGEGLTWEDLLSGDELQQLRVECKRLRQELARVRTSEWVEPESVSEKLERCVEYSECLTDWERTFVKSLVGWRGRLTPKQASRLAALLLKVRLFARTRETAA